MLRPEFSVQENPCCERKQIPVLNLTMREILHFIKMSVNHICTTKKGSKNINCEGTKSIFQKNFEGK